MWDNKNQICRESGKLNEPSQAGGLLGEALLKMAAKGAYNAARLGASKAVKSNFAKKRSRMLQTNILIKL